MDKPTRAEVRAWAMAGPAGHAVSRRGTLPKAVVNSWNLTFPDRPYHEGIASLYEMDPEDHARYTANSVAACAPRWAK